MVLIKKRDESTFKRDDFTSVHEDFEGLRTAMLQNRSYLKYQRSTIAKEIDEVFDSLQSLVQEAEDSFECIKARAHDFDFDERTRANGYWSVLVFAITLIRRTSETVKAFTVRKNSRFFNKANYLREIRFVLEGFFTLTSSLDLCKQIMAKSDKGVLILNESHTFKEFFSVVGRFNQYCLFGKFNSIQLSESVGKAIRIVSGFQAAYSEIYYRERSLLRAMWRCLKIILDEDQRALRSVAISQYASPRFFKSFMLLTEKGFFCYAMKSLNAFTLPVSVNKLLFLKPSALTLENVNGHPVKIPVPTSQIGPSPLPVRLLSKTRRRGMAGRTRSRSLATELVLHFHGGGFIGHTSSSHEIYLRRWARQLDCPVVSVDYSLSPEIPYPRPVEEAFFAYCYTLKYPEKFGWAGGKIVVAGDSAGGTLVADVLIKIVQFKLRPPDGAVLIYAPLHIMPVTSPGRFLNFLDPIFSMGFLASFVKCYLNKVDLLSRYDFHERKIKHIGGLVEKLVTDNLKYGLSDWMGSDNRLETHLQPEHPGFWIKLLGLKRKPDETDNNDLKNDITRDIFNPIPFCLDDMENAPQDPLLSPLLTSDDILQRMPPISLLTTDFDPYIDDSIEFAKRLKCLGVKTKLQVLEGINHGFLYLCALSDSAAKGSDSCCQLIVEHFRRCPDRKTCDSF